VRGAAAGDRVFCMIGTGSGVIGLIATHGAPNALAGAITGVGLIGGGLVFRQATGRHQMVVGLNTAAAIFACAAIGAAAGQGRLLVAGFATLLTGFVLEIRHIHLLNMLDGRRWTGKIPDDDIAPDESTPRRPPIPNPVAGRRRRLRRLRLAALAARGAGGSRRLRLAALAACGAWVRGRRDQNERPGEMRTPSGMSEIGMILKLASPSGMPMIVRHSDMPLSR
jgi:putative Mg2+ transporter-C (MgtC) family protein